MALRHDEGIVLRGFPFGEADRIVVLLSPHSGKMRTVAKGIRKTKSRFGGRLEPFSHVDLVVYEGKGLDVITQVDTLASFPRLRSDFDRVGAASTMTEAVDAVAQEGQSSVSLFELLRAGLTALEQGPMHSDIVTAFLLQLASVVGVAPALDSCALCGRTVDLDRFGLQAGGAVCSRCHPDGAVRIRGGVTEYLAGLATAELANLPPVDPVMTVDAMGLTRRFVEFHLEHRLASLSSIETGS